MAARLGVADRVQIESVPDRHAMRALLNAAAVVLQLSEYESHGLAALEGVAAGRPVLVSGTSALAEMAEAGWATAVPPGAAPARIAAEIIDLLRAPRRGGPPNGLPTWDATATDLLALYRKVLSSAPGADT
jgi:glycosyltransferase involved in cell wall biosynthesis